MHTLKSLPAQKSSSMRSLLFVFAILVRWSWAQTDLQRQQANSLDKYDACLEAALVKPQACNNAATEPILKAWSAAFSPDNDSCGKAKRRCNIPNSFCVTSLKSGQSACGNYRIFEGKPVAPSATCQAEINKCGGNPYPGIRPAITSATRRSIQQLDKYDACMGPITTLCTSEPYALQNKAVFVNANAACGPTRKKCYMPREFCMRAGATTTCVLYGDFLTKRCTDLIIGRCGPVPGPYKSPAVAFKRAVAPPGTRPFIRRRGKAPLPLFLPKQKLAAAAALGPKPPPPMTSCKDVHTKKTVRCRGTCLASQDPKGLQYTFYCACGYLQAGGDCSKERLLQRYAPTKQTWTGFLVDRSMDPAQDKKPNRFGKPLIGLYFVQNEVECLTYCQSFNSVPPNTNTAKTLSYDCNAVVYSKGGLCFLYKYKPINACASWLKVAPGSVTAYLKPVSVPSNKFNICV